MKIDYAKIKAMAESILECIGDESEGEKPKLPKQDDAEENGGQDKLSEVASDDDEDEKESDKKKKSDPDVKSLYAAYLSSKFAK